MTSTNECQIGTTRIPNARINEDTLLLDGMRDGDFFTVVYRYTDTLYFYAVTIENEHPVLVRWPQDGFEGNPIPLTIDGKTIVPGDIIRAEHGRKFAIRGEYYQLDLSPIEPRFVDC